MSDEITKILIIEDDKELQTVYGMILRSQGYRVEIAADGVEGLQVLKNFVPDIILLDYLMPRMDGKTFLQNYDASKYRNTTIIVASNVSDQHILDELVELGATMTVLKANLSPTQLLGVIDDTVNQTRHATHHG